MNPAGRVCNVRTTQNGRQKEMDVELNRLCQIAKALVKYREGK